jgi:hypothetical protein
MDAQKRDEVRDELKLWINEMKLAGYECSFSMVGPGAEIECGYTQQYLPSRVRVYYHVDTCWTVTHFHGSKFMGDTACRTAEEAFRVAQDWVDEEQKRVRR